MFRKAFCFFVGVMLCNHLLGEELALNGLATNGLQPVLRMERLDNDWYVEIDYRTMTNVTWHTWLMISNKVGAKLALRQTNGIEISLIDASARAVWDLPFRTTVHAATEGIERRWRPRQWWGGVRSVRHPWSIWPATWFRLKAAFGVPFTNDFILSVSPLMYKVETNGETAHLIEFPPIRVKLKTDGTVEKLE